MPALTKARLAKESKQLHPPLFSQAQTQPKRHRQHKVKKPTQDIDPLQQEMAQPLQGFNPTQAKITQPLLIDPLSTYPPQHDRQEENSSNMSLTFQAPHTYGKIEWGPYHEPLFLPIPPGQESVPTTPNDEQSQTFKSYHPHTSTSNPPTLPQAIVHLSDDSNTKYGISNEEMARACQNKAFHKNFKHLAAREIVKFNTSSQVQIYSTSDNMPPMINFDSHKGKEPLDHLTTSLPTNLGIPQGTFENININPLFDTGNKDLLKYPKRTLRLDFSHMTQQQPDKDVSLGVTNIPSLGATPQCVPLMLTNATSSADMGPPMNTLSGTSNVVEPTLVIQ